MAWVVDVNMGYGHQRTAYPLKSLAIDEKIINANSYEGIPDADRKTWEASQKFYEFISRFKKIPFLGNLAFSIFDAFQKILSFYPKRDLSKPNFALRQTYSLFKKGWGKDLIEKIGKNPAPLISTFFIPAFMAEFFNYPGEIFCVVCDADISRSWAPLNPQKSRIKYFAPTERVKERLKLYGVKTENIFLTGYPLPVENIENSKQDLKQRILNLDPQKKYFEKYETLIKNTLGDLPQKSDHPLTIMFAVGGAGAQKEIGIKILKSLAPKIKTKEIKVIISIGTRKEIKEYFEESGAEIILSQDIDGYFQKFSQALRKTDILWTKPSELSFYTALGLPIIIAPSIGSQEDFNQEWLLRLGSGEIQENPNYTNEWLFDELNSGWFAEAAMQGFIEGEKMGTYNIQKIISKCSGF
jgi:UDP-N-acetylglucosamine:LPS N-acetylglucosamine transferase